MSGNSALIKEAPEGFIHCLFCNVRIPQEDGFPWIRKWALTRQHTESIGALILDLPASNTVWNKVLFFISHPICGILLKHSEQIKTQPRSVILQGHSGPLCDTAGIQVITSQPDLRGEEAGPCASRSIAPALLPQPRQLQCYPSYT